MQQILIVYKTEHKQTRDPRPEQLYTILMGLSLGCDRVEYIETAESLYECIACTITAVLTEKMVQHQINKEMCTVSVAFPLFCPTPVSSHSPLH
jgi:hypothetical protein